MKIGDKTYKHITIKKDGETVCKMTDSNLELALGYQFITEVAPDMVSREELLNLALSGIDEKIRNERISASRFDVEIFIERVQPLISKRKLLKAELEELLNEKR